MCIRDRPCTTPKFERKTLYDALTLIADKMGVKEQFTEGKTQEEWIKELYEKTREKDTELPTYDEAMEMGVYTRKNPKGATIAFEAFRNDPAANPLDTPTGKIEIYSETLAGIASTLSLIHILGIAGMLLIALAVVYWIIAMTGNLDGRPRKVFATVVGAASLLLSLSIGAVSYTHLDVYKRQG